jgi:hypothetical protein
MSSRLDGGSNNAGRRLDGGSNNAGRRLDGGSSNAGRRLDGVSSNAGTCQGMGIWTEAAPPAPERDGGR